MAKKLEKPIYEKDMNSTELRQILQIHYKVKLSRAIPHEELLGILQGDVEFDEEAHVDPLLDERCRLERWVKENWALLNNQLHCSGNCTTSASTDVQVVSCYMTNASKLK